MIETFINLVQVVVLTICAGISLYTAFRKHSRTWTILFFFYGTYLLGDIYWQICLFYYGSTPEISVVSDLSWYAAYLFIYLLLSTQVGKDKPVQRNRKRYVAFIGPVFTVLMAVFYMNWGEIASNIVYAVIMGAVLYTAISCLLNAKCEQDSKYNIKALSNVSIVIVLLEYGDWTFSCFWDIPVMQYAYYASDFLMTLSFPLFFAAMKKEVAG